MSSFYSADKVAQKQSNRLVTILNSENEEIAESKMLSILAMSCTEHH